MNIEWMEKYAVIKQGTYIDMVRYPIPLSEKQILSARKRLAEPFMPYEDVQLVRVYG